MKIIRSALGHLKICRKITLTRNQSYSIVEMLIRAIMASPEFDLNDSLKVFVIDVYASDRKEKSLKKFIKESEVYKSLDRKTKRFAMDFCIENYLFYFTLMKSAFRWDLFDAVNGEISDDMIFLFYESGRLACFGGMIDPIDIPRAWEVTLLN